MYKVLHITTGLYSILSDEYLSKQQLEHFLNHNKQSGIKDYIYGESLLDACCTNVDVCPPNKCRHCPWYFNRNSFLKAEYDIQEIDNV